MRPDEQEVGQPVVEHAARARARGAAPVMRSGVDGDRQDAGRGEPQLLEFLPVVLGIAERQIDAARPASASSLAAQRGQPEEAGLVRREEVRRRDVVVLQHPPAGQRANAWVIGDGRAKWKMVRSPRRARRIGERPHVARADRRRSSGRRGRTRAPCARSRSRTRRALSPMASPRCAAGTHWLTIIGRSPHVAGGSSSASAALASAPPAARGTPGGTGAAPRDARPARHLSQKSKATPGCAGAAARRAPARRSRAAACRRSPSPAADRAPRPARRRSAPADARSDTTASISAATCSRVLRVVENARAVHGRRHGGRGVGQHRHALVERLDQRDAEPFVFARAQEHVRHVVERRQLLVGDVAQEMHVRRTPSRAISCCSIAR